MYEIEKQSYPPDAAATLEAFLVRRRRFPGLYFVAEAENGELVGVVNGIRTDHPDLSNEGLKGDSGLSEDGAYFCVLTVAVHPEWRRQGIGLALMRELLAAAGSAGLQGILLMCEEHLIPFYEALGFTYVRPSASTHGGIAWHEMKLSLI
ncbi:GNAT family N-acetyltransferase [Paenibacillus sp. y28]|uniref:GNAT family N-acetyltransferase n=1 Tax=Paenibacillus sp. y28 TaxID=3129110 RepID=UPI003018A019